MRLFKHTYTGKAGKQKTAKWYVEARFKGKRIRLPAYKDKNASAEFGRKVERLVELAESNAEYPSDIRRWLESLSNANRDRMARLGLLGGHDLGTLKPLSEHTADFLNTRRQAKKSDKHISGLAAKIDVLVTSGRFKWWPDLSPQRIRDALANLQAARGWSAQTRNHYLAALHQFCLWMLEEGRSWACPTRGIGKANVAVDRRRERRALTEVEIGALIAATETGPVVFRIPGAVRAMLYRVAVETGLRASELKSLTVGSFNLDSATPCVSLKARDSKRRKADELPIRKDTAERLGQVFNAKPVDAAAFQMPRVDQLARMFRKDVEAAGIAYIDSQGRVSDFHGLRHTFVTRLDRAGCSLKTAQTLARHSTPSLTLGTYTHSERELERRAVESLPPVGTQPPAEPDSESLVRSLAHQSKQDWTELDSWPQETVGVLGLDVGANNTHPIDDAELAACSASDEQARRSGRVVDCGGFENR